MSTENQPFKGEKIFEDSTSRKRWKYIDTELGIDQLSREFNKTTKQRIYYPRGFEGGNKYENIEQFIYEGFKSDLPVGVYKSVNYGWGFTKTMAPLATFIDKTLKLKKVIIQKKGDSKIDGRSKSIIITEADITNLHTVSMQRIEKRSITC